MRDRFLKDISRLCVTNQAWSKKSILPMDITDSSVINNEKLHQCHSQSLENVAPPAVTHVRWGWPLGCIIPKQEPNISNNNDNNDNNSYTPAWCSPQCRRVVQTHRNRHSFLSAWLPEHHGKAGKTETTIPTGRCLAKANTLFVFPHVVSSVCECVSIKVSHV